MSKNKCTCHCISTEGPELSYREELRHTSCNMCPSCDLYKKLCETSLRTTSYNAVAPQSAFVLVPVGTTSPLRTMSSAPSAEKCIFRHFLIELSARGGHCSETPWYLSLLLHRSVLHTVDELKMRYLHWRLPEKPWYLSLLPNRNVHLGVDN